MRRVGLVVMIAVIAAKGHAATKYRLEIHRQGWPQASSSSVTVTVDGANVRTDFDRQPDDVITHDMAVSRDGGSTFVGINHELRTWFPLDTSPFVLRPLTLFGMTGKAVVRNINWSTSEKEHTGEGELSYVLEERFQGVSVKIKCTASVQISSTSTVDARLWPGHVPFLTGIPEVDAQITSSAELLLSFPERIVLIATKQYEGGSPVTETISMKIVEIQSLEKVVPDLFERPRGYVEQAPIVAAPGS